MSPGTRNRTPRSIWILPAVMCLLFAAGPAAAGQYVIDSNQPTGSGSVTVTAAQNNSYHYSGYYPAPSPQSLTNLNFSAATAYGTITYTASETWSFHWEPDPGMTIQQDPPVDDAWEISYEAGINFGNPGPAYDQAGEGTASITVDASMYDGEAEVIPAVYDYMTEISPREENYLFDGEPIIVIGFELTGENPSITITASGSGTVDGEMELIMSLGGVNPYPASEMIRHDQPLDDNDPGINQTYPVNQAVDVLGGWRGLNGSWYKIEQFWRKQIPGTLKIFVPIGTQFDTNPPQADGANHGWTGYDITPTSTGWWTSKVNLKRKNAQGDYEPKKTHFRNFKVVP
jgi:hypothetical protein